MSERCTIIIEYEPAKSDLSFREEDIVKQVWPYMVPFFTRRHGCQQGEMTLNDNVSILWRYETVDRNDERETE